MSLFERRLLYLGCVFFFLACMLLAGNQNLSLTAYAADNRSASLANATYYGADLSSGGGMEKATGIKFDAPQTRPSRHAWPQRAGNYCFLAVVQAVVNYEYWKQDNQAPAHFPSQTNQGPASPLKPWNSGTSTGEHSPQILWDMDTNLKPAGKLNVHGSGNTRRPFTLANTSHDFGGDPRAQNIALNHEAPAGHFYHQYLYHTGTDNATLGLARAVATPYADGFSPAIALVDLGRHAVVVAGVWSVGDPTQANPQIDSLAVYNPWDESWGSYLDGAYYARISYNTWTTSTLNGNTYWWKHSYKSNNGLDPDPYLGIYQAGTDPFLGATKNPKGHHWINSFVTIQRDSDGNSTSTDNADSTFNENGQLMTGP